MNGFLTHTAPGCAFSITVPFPCWGVNINYIKWLLASMMFHTVKFASWMFLNHSRLIWLVISWRVYEQELGTTAPLPNHRCTESGSKWRHQRRMAVLVYEVEMHCPSFSDVYSVNNTDTVNIPCYMLALLLYVGMLTSALLYVLPHCLLALLSYEQKLSSLV